ncbi:hypothetical protein P280DRAFT_553746 [Massarina eburnea CBS 473.64]|uniref:Uncharacterized protein n=1 Tax=Massarina eburnea CBS 473.64 TaxID=1395130 RepID=A0A6A6RMZ8_9PLEO|nr:hypothetical protein P280DRAFT_553746 [Massarina eburnea CBS 473.64]
MAAQIRYHPLRGGRAARSSETPVPQSTPLARTPRFYFDQLQTLRSNGVARSEKSFSPSLTPLPAHNRPGNQSQGVAPSDKSFSPSLTPPPAHNRPGNQSQGVAPSDKSFSPSLTPPPVHHRSDYHSRYDTAGTFRTLPQWKYPNKRLDEVPVEYVRYLYDRRDTKFASLPRLQEALEQYATQYPGTLADVRSFRSTPLPQHGDRRFGPSPTPEVDEIKRAIMANIAATHSDGVARNVLMEERLHSSQCEGLKTMHNYSEAAHQNMATAFANFQRNVQKQGKDNEDTAQHRFDNLLQRDDENQVTVHMHLDELANTQREALAVQEKWTSEAATWTAKQVETKMTAVLNATIANHRQQQRQDLNDLYRAFRDRSAEDLKKYTENNQGIENCLTELKGTIGESHKQLSVQLNNHSTTMNNAVIQTHHQLSANLSGHSAALNNAVSQSGQQQSAQSNNLYSMLNNSVSQAHQQLSSQLNGHSTTTNNAVNQVYQQLSSQLNNHSTTTNNAVSQAQQQLSAQLTDTNDRITEIPTKDFINRNVIHELQEQRKLLSLVADRTKDDTASQNLQAVETRLRQGLHQYSFQVRQTLEFLFSGMRGQIPSYLFDSLREIPTASNRIFEVQGELQHVDNQIAEIQASPRGLVEDAAPINDLQERFDRLSLERETLAERHAVETNEYENTVARLRVELQKIESSRDELRNDLTQALNELLSKSKELSSAEIDLKQLEQGLVQAHQDRDQGYDLVDQYDEKIMDWEAQLAEPVEDVSLFSNKVGGVLKDMNDWRGGLHPLRRGDDVMDTNA